MKMRTFMVGIGLCVLVVVSVLVLVGGREKGTEPTSLEESFTLPASATDASYLIEGREVSLRDGFAETDAAEGSASKATTQLWGEPVKGDVNDDGIEDVVVLLTHSSGGSGTFVYVAAAIGDGTGYLGTNAVLLGDRIAPQTITVREGVVAVNFATHGSDQAMTDAPREARTAYLTVSGTTLSSQGPFQVGEEVLWGELVYGHEVRTFTPCGSSTTYWIDGGSRVVDILKTIYDERVSDQATYTSTLVVLAGRVVDPPTEGFGAEFEYALDARSVLSAPKHGACNPTSAGVLTSDEPKID